jgi:hypothetical protein
VLRVKLEHVPPLGGTPKLLGIMEIANDGTGTEDTGNYNVALRGVGGGRPQKEGRVEAFQRKEYGRWELVFLALMTLAAEGGLRDLHRRPS